MEGVAEHRANTRQRHLSSGSDDIASNYFATQFGSQQQQQQLSKQNSRTNSKTNSRRNSISQGGYSTSFIQSSMANAAAKIAQLKKTEREDSCSRYKQQHQSFQQQSTTQTMQTVHSTTQQQCSVVETQQSSASFNGHCSADIAQQPPQRPPRLGQAGNKPTAVATVNSGGDQSVEETLKSVAQCLQNGDHNFANGEESGTTIPNGENLTNGVDSYNSCNAANSSMMASSSSQKSSYFMSSTTSSSSMQMESSMQNGHAQIMTGMQNGHSENLTSMQNGHAANMTSIQNGHTTSVQNGHTTSMTSMQNSHVTNMSSMQNGHVTNSSSMQNGYATSMTMENGHDESHTSMKNGHANSSNSTIVQNGFHGMQNGHTASSIQNGMLEHENMLDSQHFGACNGTFMQSGKQQQVQQQTTNSRHTESKVESHGSAVGSRRGSTQFSYLSLLPDDGSFPHRTQPIGDPSTKRSNSTAPTPDREVGRKWSVSSSTDYLNKAGRNYSIRSNPMGLAEPSLGRDGYAVGKDGSMYRSTGNLNVAGGSRAGSETRDTPNYNWKERRSSSAEVKGSGIRTGGNLIEPSSKPPPSMLMPFGSNNLVKRKISKTSTTVSKAESRASKRERNKTISGESGAAMASLSQTLNNIQSEEKSEVINVTLTRRPRRAQSMPRGQVSVEESSFTVSLPGSRVTSRQTSVEPENRKKLSRHGSVEIFDGGYNLTVPNKMSRHASQTKLEEVHADHYFFPGCVESSDTEVVKRPPVVETKEQPSVKCIAVSVHKNTDVVSVDSSETSKDSKFTTELTSLTNKIAQYTSQNKEELNNSVSTSASVCQTSGTSVDQQTNHSTTQQQQSVLATTVHQQQQQEQQLQHTTERREVVRNRSRHASGANGSAVQNGGKFNISTGLKRSSRAQSKEEIHTQQTSTTERQQQTSTTVVESSACVGSALKSIDTTLQKLAKQQQNAEQLQLQQQQQGQLQYVAKVSSKQTSRRCSVSGDTGAEEVTNVTVSLPPSRTGSRVGSRAGSRRNSIDFSKKSSRRNSLDIYTAEYAVKIGSTKKIDSMEQKSAFHFKVDNEEESGLNLCGRCHLPTHRTDACTEYNDSLCPRCLSWDHWENSCPVLENQYVCTRCNYIGHLEEVHDVTKFTQRRTCVDLLGWEPFKTWFYETDFRNWWQVSGCVGVPLYRIYPRKTEWRRERPPAQDTHSDDASTGGGAPGGSQVARADSVDDMIAQVMSQRRVYRPSTATGSTSTSGRTTPDGDSDRPLVAPAVTDSGDMTGNITRRKVRTFSETLRSLDEDILAELDVK